MTLAHGIHCEPYNQAKAYFTVEGLYSYDHNGHGQEEKKGDGEIATRQQRGSPTSRNAIFLTSGGFFRPKRHDARDAVLGTGSAGVIWSMLVHVYRIQIPRVKVPGCGHTHTC